MEKVKTVKQRRDEISQDVESVIRQLCITKNHIVKHTVEVTDIGLNQGGFGLHLLALAAKLECIHSLLVDCLNDIDKF